MAMLLQVMSTTLILVVQSTDTTSWLSKVPGIKECGADKGCYSLQVAFRIGFATAVLFAFQLVLSLLGRCMANKVLNSFWVFKFFFVIAGAGVCLLIPNGFFTVWGHIAAIILGWFLLVQMLQVIDFAFSWNDLWVTNAAEDRAAGKSGKAWYAGILFFALSALAGAYTWYGILFDKYADFHANRSILGVNVGISTGLGLFSVFSPRGGILPAALVVLYIAWLSWSTVLSGQTDITSDTQLGIGLSLAGVVLIYTSYQAGMPQTASKTNAPAPAAETPAVEGAQPVDAPAQVAAMEAGEKKTEEAPKPEVGSARYIWFINSMHLSAACYLMTLCLSWSGSPTGADSMINYWVHAVAGWVMMALYGWTLVAPLICANRQF